MIVNGQKNVPFFETGLSSRAGGFSHGDGPVMMLFDHAEFDAELGKPEPCAIDEGSVPKPKALRALHPFADEDPLSL